jgi:hypothetical protein
MYRIIKSYFRRRRSSVSLLKERQILHNTSLPWKNYFVVFNLLGDILIGFEYFLSECDALMFDGNLRIWKRNASRFLAYYTAAKHPSYYFMPQHFKNISNVSIIKTKAVSCFTYNLPVSFCFQLFFFPFLCLIIFVQNQIHYTNRQNDVLLYLLFPRIIVGIGVEFYLYTVERKKNILHDITVM